MQSMDNDNFWNSFLLSQDRQYSSYTEDHVHHKMLPHFYSSFLPLQLSSFLICESSALPLDTRSEVNAAFCLNSIIFSPSPSLSKAFIKQIMESREYEVLLFYSFLPLKAVKGAEINVTFVSPWLQRWLKTELFLLSKAFSKVVHTLLRACVHPSSSMLH